MSERCHLIPLANASFAFFKGFIFQVRSIASLQVRTSLVSTEGFHCCSRTMLWAKRLHIAFGYGAECHVSLRASPNSSQIVWKSWQGENSIRVRKEILVASMHGLPLFKLLLQVADYIIDLEQVFFRNIHI